MGTSTSHSPRRIKNDKGIQAPVDIGEDSIDKESIDNVMLEIQKLEKEVGTISMDANEDDEESLKVIDDQQHDGVLENIKNEDYNEADILETPTPSVNDGDEIEADIDTVEHNLNDNNDDVELIDVTGKQDTEAEAKTEPDVKEDVSSVIPKDVEEEKRSTKEVEETSESNKPQEVKIDSEESKEGIVEKGPRKEEEPSKNVSVKEKVLDKVVERVIDRHDSFVAVTATSKGDTTTSDDKQWRDMISSGKEK